MNNSSLYLGTSLVQTKSSARNMKVFVTTALLTMIAIVSLALPFTGFGNSGPDKAEAIPGFICDTDLGTHMGPSGWKSLLGGYPVADKRDRVLTAKEAFGSITLFASYNGEFKEKQSMVRDVSDERAKQPGYTISDDALKRAQELRSASTCIVGTVGTYVGDFFLFTAGFISGITSAFATYAFSTNIICPTPGEGGACFDLLKVIGGTSTAAGSSEGLIGALTQGIYMPLLILIALISGVTIAWQGIVKRQIRQAFFSALWIVFSVILGLAFLLNPAKLAMAPMAVSNSLAGCVIGSFSGANCLSSSSPSPTSQDASTICRADSGSASIPETMELIAESLTCQTWKAFILEPYAQASFGQSFEALNTVGNDGTPPGSAVKEAFEKTSSDTKPKDFCISLSLDGGSINEQGSILKLKDGKICNLATYQMFLQTSAGTPTNRFAPYVSDGQTIDLRWYRIIDVAGNSESIWAKWAPDSSGVFSKLSVGWIAVFASILGGLVIAVVSIFAIMYYVTAALMMAFAPLFFLIGVHPGRGKDILKGYGEIIISSVAKYLASAIFLIVTLAVYGGVLGSVSNIAYTLLFTIILTVGLLVYRKEIVELLGRVDMGGKKMGNFMNNVKDSWVGKTGKQAAVFGGAIAGGGIGAVLAGGSMGDGVREAAKRELQSGRVPGVKSGGALAAGISGASRSATGVAGNNKRALSEQIADTRKEAGEEKAAADEIESEVNDAISDHKDIVESIDNLANEISEQRKELESGGKEAILDKMAEKGGPHEFFVDMQRLADEIKQYEASIAEAESNGTPPYEIAEMKAERAEAVQKYNVARGSLEASGQADEVMQEYRDEVESHNNAVASLKEKIQTHNDLQKDAKAAEELIGTRSKDLADARTRQQAKEHEAEVLQSEASKAGDFGSKTLTGKRKDKIVSEAENLGEQHAAGAGDRVLADLHGKTAKRATGNPLDDTSAPTVSGDIDNEDRRATDDDQETLF